MGYMEPPRLYQPVRHCLGAVLLALGRGAESEKVRFTRCSLPQHEIAFSFAGQHCLGALLLAHGRGRKESRRRDDRWIHVKSLHILCTPTRSSCLID